MDKNFWFPNGFVKCVSVYVYAFSKPQSKQGQGKVTIVISQSTTSLAWKSTFEILIFIYVGKIAHGMNKRLILPVLIF